MTWGIFGVLDAPTLKEIYETPEELAEDLKEYTNKDFYDAFITDPKSFNTDLQADLQADLSLGNNIFLNSTFNLLAKNLLAVLGNHRIAADEEQFKADFRINLMEKLPLYHAYFRNFNLDPLKSKEAFNQDGTSSYSGVQNTDNKINDIKNFDQFNLGTFTPEEIERQQKLRSNKINEFIYSFEYLFNGVK